MDSSFTFPRPQAAVARPRPQKALQRSGSVRQSNALRASVLDAALELGLGTNPIVAGWMFDNALPEEDEDEDPIASPGLTYTTSEESSNSALSPSSSAYSSGSSSSKFPAYGAGARALDSNTKTEGEPNITIVEASPMNPNFDQSISGMGIPGGGITFPDMPPSRPTTPNSSGKKLKKKKKDGYESDGGYLSESGKKKEKEKSKKKEKGADSAAKADSSAFFETEKEAKKRAKEEKKEQEMERKRTKSLMSAAKAAKKAEMKESGYDTDGGAIKKSKSSKKSKANTPPSAFPGDTSLGYETDGYQSSTPKKSKTRFFKLSTKSSKGDLKAGVPSVPPLPSTMPKPMTDFVPLPIAERFATTFGPLTLSGLSEDGDRSASATPLPPSAFPSPMPTTPLSATPTPPKSSLAFPSVNTRDSQLSVGSSSSNGSRSQQVYSPLSASSLAPRHGTVESIGTSVGSSSAHHGHGSGSYSTITSSLHQQQQSPVSVDIISNPAATSMSSSHSAKSGSVESSIGSLRPPALSFPAVRAPSPSRPPPPVPPPTTAPPSTPFKLLKNLRSKASVDNLHLPSLSRTRSPSPMPASPSPSSPPTTPGTPNTPFVIAPPTSSTASSPTLGVISPMQVQTMYLQAPSPAQVGLPASPISPRSPNGSFLGDTGPSPAPSVALVPPPRTVISPPNTASVSTPRPRNLSINSSVTAKASSLSPGPNPNLLAYYDLPPPSPPPTSPLPSVPSQASLTSPSSSSLLSPSGSSGNILPSPGALRQRMIDRSPRQLPPEFSAVFNGQSNIERGRQSPFPARPVAVSPSPTPSGGGESGTVTPLRRYRDLYSPTSADTLMPPSMGQPEAGSAQPLSQVKRARFRSKNSWIENDYTRGDDANEEDDLYPEEEDEEDALDLANALERYEDRNKRQADTIPLVQVEEVRPSTSLDEEREDSQDSHYTSQDSHYPSEEAYVARPRPPKVQAEKSSLEIEGRDSSRYSEYQFDDGRTIGDRTSRWSGSIYSRASIMDEDSSGQTRDRFVRRVEAMLREGNGRRDFEPPPVPRLPDAYANTNSNSANGGGTPGRSWNRF